MYYYWYDTIIFNYLLFTYWAKPRHIIFAPYASHIAICYTSNQPGPEHTSLKGHPRDNTHVVCVFARSGVSVLVGSICHEALAFWSADTLSGTWILVLTWCPGQSHCTRPTIALGVC